MMSAGDVIHRIITWTKQQPGGWWGGGFSPPYLWEGGDLQKGITTHIGKQIRQWRG